MLITTRRFQLQRLAITLRAPLPRGAVRAGFLFFCLALPAACGDSVGPPDQRIGQPDNDVGSFKSVGVGDGTTCALDQTGRAYCWGSNYRGALGTGDTAYRVTVPKLVLNTPSGFNTSSVGTAAPKEIPIEPHTRTPLVLDFGSGMRAGADLGCKPEAALHRGRARRGVRQLDPEPLRAARLYPHAPNETDTGAGARRRRSGQPTMEIQGERNGRFAASNGYHQSSAGKPVRAKEKIVIRGGTGNPGTLSGDRATARAADPESCRARP